MSLSRRKFLQGVSSATVLAIGGGVFTITASRAASLSSKSILRFVVASDGHYGQANTPSDENFANLVQHVTQYHTSNPIDFCVINGDIIHDQKEFLVPAKAFLDKLPVAYYVTKGNHDMVSDFYWEEIWKMPVNTIIQKEHCTLLLASTSNEKGEYLCPDMSWIRAALESNKKKKNIFIFLHIPQKKWTKASIDSPELLTLFEKYTAIRAVFHGHEHEEDHVKMVNQLPFLFDAHFGGNWGTEYKGFRVVELLTDQSLLTYMMNPTEKINQASFAR